MTEGCPPRATIDFAIATYKPEGIARLAEAVLPELPGVRYVVSWQNHGNAPVPVELKRPDISVYRFEGVGLSPNRNNSFEHCTAEWTVFMDDDLICHTEGIIALQERLAALTDIDIVTFVAEINPGKYHPEKEMPLSWPLPKGYYISSIEIAFRTKCGFRCRPQLGLNSPRMHGGEDEVFFINAIRTGHKARFVPVKVFTHPDVSTGHLQLLSPENIRAQGCVIAVGYPRSAWLRIPLKACRLAKSGRAPFFHALKYLLQGLRESHGLTSLH